MAPEWAFLRYNPRISSLFRGGSQTRAGLRPAAKREINSGSDVKTQTIRIVLLLLLSGVVSPQATAADEPLLTVAEKSGYRATSHYQDVVDFCTQLAKRSPIVRLSELGTSFEGRKLPLLILADPPVATPEEAKQSKKLVVYAQGNIHAGEVDGKEALLMLARDLATAKERPLLKDLIIVFAPIFNADGNERFSKTNRPGQVGPEDGMGIRQNAQGLDLNRDFVKLESPEVRSLVRFLNKWDPAVVIDTHTTNGSYHRYTITYEGPRCPAGDGRIVTLVRDELFPDVSRRLEQHGGYKSYFYGNFSPDHTQWQTVPATPRYGIHYVGLRNRIAILSESYSYAPYRERIFATRDFVRSILEYAAENQAKIHTLLTEARGATRRAGSEPKASDIVVLRSKAVPVGGPAKLLGFVEEQKNGKHVATEKPREYEVRYMGGCEPTVSVRKPYAYLFPAAWTKVVENLQRHGIEVEELREDLELPVETYRIEKVSRTERSFQNHRTVSVETAMRPETVRIPAGTILVRTAQPLGTLAAYLLEPQAEDGLCTWNFFDDSLTVGQDFPVRRLPAAVPITAGRVRPLPEDRSFNKPITFDRVYGSGPLTLPSPPDGGGEGRVRGRLNFNGSPVSVRDWLEDGDHFLQVKAGRLYKVHALTGRAQPFHDPEKMAQSLASVTTINKGAARRLARSTSFHMNPQRTAALIEHEDDLYYARFDGTKAARLTKTPGKKEEATFSPDGQFVAFVRDHNLHVVDLATQTERALTTDGNAQISNGKADWVYFEEIFDRHWQAYWWSPDSTQLVFLRFDDRPVHPFTVIDQIPSHQRVEMTPYPKAGDPNPLVRLGIVSVAGGSVHWVNLALIRKPLRSWFAPGGRPRASRFTSMCRIAPRPGSTSVPSLGKEASRSGSSAKRRKLGWTTRARRRFSKTAPFSWRANAAVGGTSTTSLRTESSSSRSRRVRGKCAAYIRAMNKAVGSTFRARGTVLSPATFTVFSWMGAISSA